MSINNSSTVVSNTSIEIKTPKPKGSGSADNVNKTSSPEAPPQAGENSGSGAARSVVKQEASQSRQDAGESIRENQQALREKVESSIESIRGFIQENQRSLDFDVAEEGNRVIITVIDQQTNEVIRQIPPEDALELAERIKRGDDITVSGLLLEGKA